MPLIKKESHHVLHSFCTYPKVKFDTQMDEEEVVLVLRAHPVTLIPYILNALFLFILFSFLVFFFSSLLNPAQLFLAILMVLIFVISYLWVGFLTYFFNVGIITNMRVIDIDFSYILYKETTATRLDKVEDTTAKSGGYFPALFNYGDVFIQTAGAERNIEYLKVPRPAEVVRIVNDLTGP